MRSVNEFLAQSRDLTVSSHESERPVTREVAQQEQLIFADFSGPEIDLKTLRVNFIETLVITRALFEDPSHVQFGS